MAPSNGSKRILRVFVASPSDVQKERVALAKVISEVNQTLAVLAPEKGLALELVRWETHTARAQPAGGESASLSGTPDFAFEGDPSPNAELRVACSVAAGSPDLLVSRASRD